MLECIPIIKLLKNDPRYLYVTRVRQPWKGFVKHFILNVLQKNLFDWECITIPRDADTFQYSGTLFSVSEYNFSSFSEWSFLTDECRPRRNVWSVFHLFLTSHLWCCVNSKQQFNIVGIQSFLSKYFFLHFFLIFIGSFSNIAYFLRQFFSIATYFHRPVVLVSIPELNNRLLFFSFFLKKVFTGK